MFNLIVAIVKLVPSRRVTVRLTARVLRKDGSGDEAEGPKFEVVFVKMRFIYF